MTIRTVGLLLALLATGCTPGVAWLPDSSGFIYTAGKSYEQLMHFDVASGKAKVLVENTGAPTFWPAVRPDGKHIAVAHEDGNAKTMQ